MDTTNKPVAYRWKSNLGYIYDIYDYGNGEPLYTQNNTQLHPAKTLELTEDEIDDVWAACSTGESDTIDMHLFAEAILRKAQEK